MQTEQLKDIIIDALKNLKVRDLAVLDVHERTSITDIMVIGSGTSKRHVNALAENVVKSVKENGLQPLGVEGKDSGDWVLVDCGDVVAHIMMPEMREFYALEKLWDMTDQHRSSQS